MSLQEWTQCWSISFHLWCYHVLYPLVVSAKWLHCSTGHDFFFRTIVSEDIISFQCVCQRLNTSMFTQLWLSVWISNRLNVLSHWDLRTTSFCKKKTEAQISTVSHEIKVVSFILFSSSFVLYGIQTAVNCNAHFDLFLFLTLTQALQLCLSCTFFISSALKASPRPPVPIFLKEDLFQLLKATAPWWQNLPVQAYEILDGIYYNKCYLFLIVSFAWNALRRRDNC